MPTGADIHQVGETSHVLFLGGLGRSGTTLLERLLGQIDGMQTLGETVHLWARGIRENERCGCGQPFRECEFWRQVGDKAFGGWDAVDVDRVLALRRNVDRMRHLPTLIRGSNPDLASYTDYYAKLYAAAHVASGARWLVDSSKHPAMAHCLRRRDDIELRVVHVVRHPGAVAHSWTKLVQRPDVTEEEGDREFMTRYTPARTAMLWDGENAATSSLRRLGVPVHLLRYEDLVADPEGALRSIVAFAGLPSDTVLPVHGSEAMLEPTHTASGNPMRFATGTVSIKSDDRWQSGLSARDRRTVTALTWPLRRAYGYTSGGQRER